MPSGQTIEDRRKDDDYRRNNKSVSERLGERGLAT
jgi:hypothetical protein